MKIGTKDINGFYNLKEDGIFYDKSTTHDYNSVSGVYMCRTNLSWEYELVTLNLMHKEAIDKNKTKKEEDRVPLKRSIKDEYKISELRKNKKLSTEDFDLLSKVNNKLQAYEKVPDDLHQKLRGKFIHHSSSFGIVNKPSMVGNEYSADEIYGKRVIYGSTGEKFD